MKAQLHFMRNLGVGMAGMIHDKDIRVAEGLSSIDLPSDHFEAMATWNKAVQDAIMDWNEGQGIDMPDLNYIWNNGLFAGVEFCFPHYFLLPYYSSASSYRIRPLGPEECLFELWSLTRYPPGQDPPHPRDRHHGLRMTHAARRSRPRTIRTCLASRKACTPRASTTCACRTGSRA